MIQYQAMGKLGKGLFTDEIYLAKIVICCNERRIIPAEARVNLSTILILINYKNKIEKNVIA